MLLAYFQLFKSNEALSGDELDGLCEDFLEDRFALKIDFAMEDSLPRLLATGLVTQRPEDGAFRAAPLESAYSLLLGKWNR